MSPRWIVVGGGLFAGAMALLFAFGSVYLIVQGPDRAAIQILCMTVFLLGTAIGLLRYGSDTVSPRVDTDGEGTTFRPDRGLEIPLQIAVFGMVGNWMCTASGLSISTSSLFWTVLEGWVTVSLILLAAGVSLWLIRQDVRWGASKYLRLTPGGVEVVGGYGVRVLSCEWDQIRNVTDEFPGRRGRRGRRMPHTVVIILSDTIVLRLPAGTFTPNGSALRDLVEFYWHHSEFRSELTDGSTPQRLGATLLISR